MDSQTNILKHIQARRLRGPVCIRRTVPTEIYSRIIMYRKLMGHLSSAYCVCFDQSGQYVFTGADDHLIKIWSARDGRLLKTLRGHDGQISDMSVNYENRLLASAGMDRIIRIWDLKTSKLLECLHAHSATVTSVKFAPYNRHGKDRYLISTSNDGSIVFWAYHVDNFQFRKLRKFQERNRPGGQIACSSFSTGGSFLACGSSDNFIHVYGFHPDIGPYWISELDKHHDKVDSVQFCNLGLRFISGSKDGTAIIWSYKAGQWHGKVLDMNTHLNQFSSRQLANQRRPAVLIVQWSRDDRYVLTSIVDYSIKVWNSVTGELVHVLREHKHDIYLIESHPVDPRIFISASHDGTMIIWDIERGKVLKKFFNPADLNDPPEAHNHASFYDIKFSPDGNMIAATDSHGYLSLYGFGNAERYKAVPDQMFFHTDYRALIRDVRHFVMDEQTHIAPHLMPRPKLVDMNGNPYPEYLQRLVPDYKDGERIVVAPLTNTQISIISEMIENHSTLEDEDYLAEKRSHGLNRISQSSAQVNSFGERFNSNNMNQSHENARYNTRYSTRSTFRTAQNDFYLPRTRRTRQRISYNEGEVEVQPSGRRQRHRLRRQRQVRYLVDESDNSTETEEDLDESTEVESDDETEIESDDETVIESDDETVIDSDATEIDESNNFEEERPRHNLRPIRRTRNNGLTSSHSIGLEPARRCSARLRDRDWKRFRRS